MDIQVNVKLPDEMTSIDSSAVSRDVLEQVVVEGYKNGSLGPRQVRELLGFESRFETEDFLHRTGAMEYTIEDLESDLKAMSDLGLR